MSRVGNQENHPSVVGQHDTPLVELCSVAQGEDIGCVDLVVRTRVAGHGFLAGSGPVSVVLDGDAQGASMRSKPQRRLWNWVL